MSKEKKEFPPLTNTERLNLKSLESTVKESKGSATKAAMKEVTSAIFEMAKERGCSTIEMAEIIVTQI